MCFDTEFTMFIPMIERKSLEMTEAETHLKTLKVFSKCKKHKHFPTFKSLLSLTHFFIFIFLSMLWLENFLTFAYFPLFFGVQYFFFFLFLYCLYQNQHSRNRTTKIETREERNHCFLWKRLQKLNLILYMK